MPSATIVSFNIGDLPWPFKKPELAAIPDRIEKIRAGLVAYDYRLIQEDWFQRIDGHACGHWYWLPSGLTLGAPAAHPLANDSCTRHRHAGFTSGDVLARKGWQMATSQGVFFAHTHLDASDADWSYRQEQAQDIRNSLPAAGPLVLGGDFNTENKVERAWMDSKFAEIGMARIPIVTNKGKDHLYTRGLTTLAFGEDAALSVLSDHPAVWASVEWM
ncbi:MAG TPA: hypothetical protein VN634_02095 [Candidatus Limnocylindrales bacterium]|nr:hypothetical protein [Candidatus Limnocylindrales bacterium]